MVDRFGGWGVDRFGGRVVWLRLIFGVDSFASVFDISNVSVVVISSVGDGLDTAIGKSNLVRSRNGFAVSGFLGVEFGTRVIIGNTVLESIGFGCFINVLGWVRGGGIDRGRGVIGSWRSSRSSNGNSHEGSKGGNAKHDK